MSTIKAIETVYKGCHFRSRLEARWAVFFENMGYEWKYENEGFESRNGYEPEETLRYLPDFELIKRDWKGEIKKRWFVEVKGDLSYFLQNWKRLAEMHDFGGILPDFSNSGLHYNTGLIVLSEVPDVSSDGVPFHPIIMHYKGVMKGYGLFKPSGFHPYKTVYDDPVRGLIGLDETSGLEIGPSGWDMSTKSIHFGREWPDVMSAYRAARQSRFEHGRCG